MKHIRAFTYKPKIVAVLKGECAQTIRPLGKEPTFTGDTTTFHGWSGRPYWSPWTWRMEVQIIEAFNIEVSNLEIIQNGVHWPWNSSFATMLARLDHIVPPTGEQLKKVLFLLNPDCNLGKRATFQVIRWNPDERRISNIPIKYIFPNGGKQ